MSSQLQIVTKSQNL